MTRKLRLLSGVLLIGLLLGAQTPVLAQAPNFPQFFYGDVTLNGGPAPSGVVITAKEGTTTRGTYTTTEAGKYGSTLTRDYLLVQGTALLPGNAIKFYIYDVVSGEATYQPGAVTQLSLAFVGTVPTAPTGGAGGIPPVVPTVPAPPPPPPPPTPAQVVAPVPTVVVPVAPVATTTTGQTVTFTGQNLYFETTAPGTQNVIIPVNLPSGQTLSTFTDAASGITLTPTATGTQITIPVKDSAGTTQMTITVQTAAALGTGTTAQAQVTNVSLTTAEKSRDFTAEKPTVGQTAYTVKTDLGTVLPSNASISVTPAATPTTAGSAAVTQAATAQGRQILDVGYALQATSVNLAAKSAEITMKVGAAFLTGKDTADIKIGRFGSSEILQTRYTGRDAAGLATFVGASPNGLGEFVLLALKPLAPARFTTAELAVTPREVRPGETVTISATVANTGETAGKTTVTLKVNDKAEQTKDVTLDPKGSTRVTFTLSRTEPGTYKVEIAGQVSQFTVARPVVPPPPPRPAEFTASQFIVLPPQVKSGETVTVSAIVANVGETAGKTTVSLKVNDQVVDSKDVSLAPKESKTVSFTVSRTDPGTYKVEISGQTGIFVVVKPPTPVPWLWIIVGIAIVALIIVLVRRRTSPF